VLATTVQTKAIKHAIAVFSHSCEREFFLRIVQESVFLLQRLQEGDKLFFGT
jgi:hypothetical protein